ncbi:MAG TPA: hypothetical protein VEU07_16380 [Candidatus Acidoferrum sp.]|nr:hypothetical protein [Candidatus Acidoferrum sp.]
MSKKTIGKSTARQNKKAAKIADLTVRSLGSGTAAAVKGGISVTKVVDKTTPN